MGPKNQRESSYTPKLERNSISKNRHEANAKERVRTCSVNLAFDMLRKLIPTEPMDRKLSKIETLRLASSYIAHLGSILVSELRKIFNLTVENVMKIKLATLINQCKSKMACFTYLSDRRRTRH